jgi:hypothetical protein
MSPRSHFADYAKRQPKDYQTFSDSMWNGFVSITHKVGLSPFFNFTPDFLQGTDAKTAGDQDQTIQETPLEEYQTFSPGFL